MGSEPMEGRRPCARSSVRPLPRGGGRGDAGPMPATTHAAPHVAPHRVRDRQPLAARDAVIEARATREDRYRIHVTQDIETALDRVAELAGERAALITDTTVEALYGPAVVAGLRRRGVEPWLRAIAPGEPSKDVPTAVALLDWLAGTELGRRDAIVCLGGGVVADLGGWVASAYMRGLRYVNVPTTLLAQVDGALGGKVAVNHPAAKNLIGAFHQPAGVVADIGFLRSVSPRHLRAGLAECIKKAMIASPAYWALIESSAGAILGGDPAALAALVRSAASIKTALVGRDPYERDLRRPLNFGHTVGHPLETVTGHRPLLHGEAVALGMVVEARIALARGLMDAGLLERLIELLRRCSLPTAAGELRAPVPGDAVVAAMGKVRLIRAGSLRWVLPVRLGETVIADDVSEGELARALEASGFRGLHRR
jgi:3-dehydroquinate synthase